MKSLILYIIFLAFLFSSCKNSNTKLYSTLTKTNKVKLICFKSKDPIGHILTDRESIQIFVDVFKKQQPVNDLQNPTQIGLIEYYYNDSLLLSVMSAPDRISYEIDKKEVSTKITYRAGMYFDEMCDSSFK